MAKRKVQMERQRIATRGHIEKMKPEELLKPKKRRKKDRGHEPAS